MKILIVCQYYYPEQFQINEIAPELSKRGHQVTVLTGLPNYPQGEIYAGYENGEKRKEAIDGVEVVRVEEHPRKRGAKDLILNYLSFARNGSKAARSFRPDYDIVFCYQLSPVTMARPAVEYAGKFKKPLLLYCLDIWPESARAHVKNDRGLLYRLIGKLSKKYYSACEHIAVTSRPFMDYLHDINGIPFKDMSYIPQHADDSYVNMDLTAEENGVVDFMYAGNMGKGQTLDVIIRAAAELKDRDGFLIHMVGDGSQRAELEALADTLKVKKKFKFYGNQKRENMPSFYKKADGLLVTLRGNNAVGNTMPGKLQTYMTTGKPIFGAINGAANEVMNESRCGACVKAGDYKGLAGLMADFMNHPDKYSACGENGRMYFKEHFTLKNYVDSLEGQMKKMVDECED